MVLLRSSLNLKTRDKSRVFLEASHFLFKLKQSDYLLQCDINHKLKIDPC
jgi:hypothetical protein